MKSKLCLFLIFTLLLVFPLASWANVEVDPTEYFGNVELGSSSTAIITIQNIGWESIIIESVALEPSGTDFVITSSPPEDTVLASGQEADVVVTFSPSALGFASATLVIDWKNGMIGTNYVVLTGVGVGAPGEPTSVQDILDFFDQFVANGTLVGDGPGNSADGRRKALRNKIKAAGDIIEDGGDACEQLLDVFQRCDGLDRPPDFIAGSAVPVLAQMISELMADLGCE